MHFFQWSERLNRESGVRVSMAAARWMCLGAATATFLLTGRSWTGGALAAAMREDPPPYTPVQGPCNATEHEYRYQGLCCRQCPPGQFAKAKCSPTKNTLCVPCEVGSYTEIWHSHYTCLPCRTRCNPDKHFVEMSTCQAHSPRVCSCVEGYTCSQEEGGQCEQCVPSLGRTQPAPEEKEKEEEEAEHKQEEEAHSPRPLLLGVLIAVPTLMFLCALLLFWRRKATLQCLKTVFRSCTQSTQANLACPVEVLPPDGPPPTNPSMGCLHSGDTEKSTNGRIGPLHIYSPGTVYVGYINNISPVASSEPPPSPAWCAPGSHLELKDTEERLQYPRQEENCHLMKDHQALQVSSSLEYWGMPTPQQEINGCGHCAISVPQHDSSEQESWSAPTPLQEKSGPESFWFQGPHQERCGCRLMEDHEALYGQDEQNSVSVLVPQQAMSGLEHFVVLSQQQRDTQLLQVSSHHQEEYRPGFKRPQ